MLIGLTGQIGAGKSTVANILRNLGAHIIDADQIGREVVNDSPTLRRKLARAFGPDILDKRGNLLRRRLAQRAFATEDTHATLNALVHPYLLKDLRKQAKLALRNHRVVVIDAALLLDWQMDREVDEVIVVTASQSVRHRRMVNRGMPLADVRSRQRRQLPMAEYRRRASVVISNNKTITELGAKVKRFWKARCILPD